MNKLLLPLAFLVLSFYSCKDQKTKANQNTENENEIVEKVEKDPFFKLSLAQWSLHKTIESGDLSPIDFAKKAKEMSFGGVEYVSQLYTAYYDQDANTFESLKKLLDTLKYESKKYQVENLIIMVDGEGDLAVTDEKERNQTVDNHKKWVDAAQYLGCHSIRVNLFGTNDPKAWVEASIDGLTKLSEYAATKEVNVIVENHGYLSSNAALLAEVMQKVNMSNCGTLPDFGNFCLKRKGGERWGAKCVEEYPKYQGIQEMMPYAKAVSAKSYDFNDSGRETSIDYKKMLEIVKEAGYSGFIGVEYEGERLTEEEGIIATRDLLIELGSQLN